MNLNAPTRTCSRICGHIRIYSDLYEKREISIDMNRYEGVRILAILRTYMHIREYACIDMHKYE